MSISDELTVVSIFPGSMSFSYEYKSYHFNPEYRLVSIKLLKYTLMMTKFMENIWYGWLKRPYKLFKSHDHGQGQGIVLLHGLGRSGRVWLEVQKLLENGILPCRVVTYDLLGFGQSPKPTSINYDVDDHAQAVIHQLKQLKGGQPVILVGHSMGSLVAVRVAKLRPDLVKHLVLYEMPLYEGLPKSWHYRTRINLYFKLYDWIIKQNPSFDEVKKRLSERLTTKVVGTDISADTWQPFIKSLKNTIMSQSADTDLPTLTMPADIIYGSRDMLVIKGKVKETLGLDSNLVTTHTIRERHIISKQASAFIVERIDAALKLDSI